MSDDEDFVPSAGVCMHCGYAKAYGHVCRAAGKQMRSTFSRKSMYANKLGKRPAFKVGGDVATSQEPVSLLDSDDETHLSSRAKKPRTAPPPDDKNSGATDPDPHAFLTSILNTNSSLTSKNEKMTVDNNKLSKIISDNELSLKALKAELMSEKSAHSKTKSSLTSCKKSLSELKKESKTTAAAPVTAVPLYKETASAPGSSTGLNRVAKAYEEIIDEVTTQFQSQIKYYAKTFPPPPPPAPPPAPPQPGPQYAKIEQFNINPQYPTTREIKFWSVPQIALLPTSTTGTSPLQRSMFGHSPGFYFEDGMAGSENWRAIQDATAI